MTSSNTELKREYRVEHGQDLIVGLIAGQLNRVMEYRSKRLLEYFIESVEALIDLLPPEMEEIVVQYKHTHDIIYDVSPQGKDRYIDLFRFIKKQLTKQNIVWKRSRGFEIGHD